MTEPNGDLKPSLDYDTATVRVVAVDLSLVEILGNIEEETGKVADNVHDNYRTQSPG